MKMKMETETKREMWKGSEGTESA